MPYINGKKVLGVVRTKYLNVDDVYPVGAVYISFDSTSPAQLFGGTWERLNNAFLYATNNDNNIGDTGGSDTHSHSSGDLVADIGLENDTADQLRMTLKTLENYKRTTHYITTNNAGTNTGMYYNRVVQVDGNTASASSMPPLVKVAIWKRVPDEEE